jgi:hypothetical protein
MASEKSQALGVVPQPNQLAAYDLRFAYCIIAVIARELSDRSNLKLSPLRHTTKSSNQGDDSYGH